ncbi:MAG: thioredoxin family protein [Bacteroidales bacterium]|jgi:thiol-disulfide isomerase/thioredoxin|nr:thioredoxin family protein [Bacteroidales bacterium]HOW10674.1 thioredoxin family protein [Bacteroidales bacterium]
MRKCVFTVALLTLISAGCGTGKPALENLSSGKPNAENTAMTNFSEPSTWLLGYIQPFQFTGMPHAEWYLKGFESYSPAGDAIEKLKGINQDDLTIKIVLGTWCPDSRREVPRFMKVLEQWGFPSGKVTFIGVDISKNAPVGGYEELGIERVPTFIIMKNKIETGRIIENPVTSLEQDMLNILTRNENNAN